MTYYRRNLPHWQPQGKSIFLTWRLYGSLPASISKKFAAQHLRTSSLSHSLPSLAAGKRFVVMDRLLDAAPGPRWLSNPKIAACVEISLLRGAELRRFELQAYVIMPNHVHVMLQPRVALQRITNAIKGAAARAANAVLGRTGKPFWQDESFDHWVRNSREFERICHYIEQNPVTAGLVDEAEDWRWSSASSRWFKFLENSKSAQPGMAVPLSSAAIQK